MYLPTSLQESMQKLLENTKVVYTIIDKLSGQPSGYALMLSDNFVSPDLIQLLPWQASHSHGDGDVQPDREGESGSRCLTPGSLASDLYISEDSSVNSTVEDGLSVSAGQEILDVSGGSRVDIDNDVREATQIDVDDDAKFRVKYNNPPVFNSGTSRKSSLAHTFAADIASKLAAEKRAVSRNICQSVMGEDSFGSSKSSRESARKQTYEQSVPGKSSQGIQSKYAAFFTDVGVTQPEDNRKGKLVKCLLCEKDICSSNLGRHLRALHEPYVLHISPGNQSRYAAFFTDVDVTQPENYRKGKLVRCLLCKKEIVSEHIRSHVRGVHEPSVECDICGGEYSSLRITMHKKICTTRSLNSTEMRVKEPRSSINLSKSENREVEVKFQETTHLYISQDSSVNSTVEDGLSVSGQEILDMSRGSRVDTDNDVRDATQIDVDDDTKIRAKYNNPPVFNSGTSHKSSLEQTFVGEIASKLAAEKRADSRNMSQSVVDEDSFGTTKSSRESAMKQTYEQSVPGKSSQGIQSKYAAFFTDVGVTQPEDNRKGKLVKCLLCKKDIGSKHFGRHLRAVHESSVECDIWGGEFSSQRITGHKKICTTRSLKSPVIKNRYAAYFTDVGVTQPEDYKDKLVRCLLCKKEIGYSHFGRHLRALHEPSVECDICGGEFSSQRITGHKKICTTRSLKSTEIRVKEPRSSINLSKSENSEVEVKFQEMRAQESRWSENQMKSENEKVKLQEPYALHISPVIKNRYTAYFTDVGVTQPEDYKDKLVRCLLCKKEIGFSHFGEHIRAVHEPSVKCDICGGEFSSQRITGHKKNCIATSFKSPEMRVKGTTSSINQSKSEKREVNLNLMFRKLKAQELKLENEEVKFKLISAMRPEIGIKVALKRNVKIKKAMKIFAKKYNVNRKKLSFGISGVKLTGDELVSELKGSEIIVHGKVNLT